MGGYETETSTVSLPRDDGVAQAPVVHAGRNNARVQQACGRDTGGASPYRRHGTTTRPTAQHIVARTPGLPPATQQRKRLLEVPYVTIK